MIILGIETSCDETALCLIKTGGSKKNQNFEILGNELISQSKIHEQYGGVFPVVAKREHGRNLIPLFLKIISESNSITGHQLPVINEISESKIKIIESILDRETELKEIFLKTLPYIKKPQIDKIAVTTGPGLEPALWVGICFARALSELFGIPIVPVNHMEGHIFSALLKEEPKIPNNQFLISNSIQNPKSAFYIPPIKFPALALLISGGHTELVLMKDWKEYEVIGKTRDDAVGEAFDKVARILGLSYPGGPQISALAEEARNPKHKKEISENAPRIKLPRPMIHSKDFDFSFSGLKTAVLYMVKEIPDLTPNIKQEIAKDFEDSVTEVLIKKTENAMEEFGVETLILGGGVIANTHIRESFITLGRNRNVLIYMPEIDLSTDNGLMIALAGAFNQDIKDPALLVADGNLRLGHNTKTSD